MYKVIKNGRYLTEWMQSLPHQAGVFGRSELLGKRLAQSVQCLEESYGSERNLKTDLGGFVIVLYGTSRQVAEHYKKIINYFKLKEEDFEYEDRYREPERSTIVTFRLYLCSSDYGVEIVTIRNQVKSLESRLKEGDWWQANNECLCLQDIMNPPSYFGGNQRQWIEEVTSYQYSYPVQWKEVYREYLHRAKSAGNLDKTIIGFRRTEDGYLRKDGEKDVYLKIVGVEPLSFSVLEQMGIILSKQVDESFQSYLEYCETSEQKRTRWKKQIKEKINNLVPDKEIIVNFTESLDESEFRGSELYWDILNHLYIIL